MSFDLFAYIGEINNDKLAKWQQCLEQAGINCHILKDLDFSEKAPIISVSCKLYPPLAEQGTYVDDCEFTIEAMPIDKEHIGELLNSTKDLELIEKIKAAKYEVAINTLDESEDVALKIICFVTAALANAFDGLLFDPQEHGAVYGTKAYDVARYYTEYSKKAHKVKKPIHSKPKEESTVLVRSAFIIIFIIILLNVIRKI
jgi:hypothetical protein